MVMLLCRTILRSPRSSLLRYYGRQLATNSHSASWRDRLQQWDNQLSAAEAGDATALVDCGWAHHNGLIPTDTESITHPPDIQKALFLYNKAEKLKYPPASSLLADLHFYGHEKDIPMNYNKAMPHLEQVISNTSPEEQNDAYLRVRAFSKLGVASFQSYDEPSSSNSYFSSAISACRTHLGNNYAFLLSHDPVAFFENLEAEKSSLDDVPKLIQNLQPFVTEHESPAPPLPYLLQLRSYTNKMRQAEASDDEWVLQLANEVQSIFPQSSASGSWGVTYLHSFMRVIGHPAVQSTLSSLPSPHMVSLGSALGNSVIWPSAAFGFTGFGFDALSTCITKTKSILESLEGKPGSHIRDMVGFEVADILRPEHNHAVFTQLEKASVVWSNDFTWGEEKQGQLERMCFENMRPGAVLILYRKPVERGLKWDIGGVVKVPTSWDPECNVVILKKPEL